MKNIFKLALEDDTSGLAVVEKELTFYARIDSLKELTVNAKTIIEQVQFQLRIAKEGVTDHRSLPRLRVRSSKHKDQTEVEYTQTIKIKNGDHDIETTILISEDFFKQFKSLAENGMCKTRYTLDISDRDEKWEMDVFFNENGAPFNWVKVDYEFKSNLPVPALPDFLHDIIAGSTTDTSEKEFIEKLYSSTFLTKL